MESLVERIAVAVSLVLSLTHCGKTCTDISITSSLSVFLKDAKTGESICDGNVWAQKSGEESPIVLMANTHYTGDCIYRGIRDNPGTYIVIAKVPGYKDKSVSNLRLEEGDDCHVIGQTIQIDMEPE